MRQGITLLVYPVRNIERAKALYREVLDVEPYADAPYYVGFRIGDQEIGLDPKGHEKDMNGPLATSTLTISRPACSHSSRRGHENGKA